MKLASGGLMVRMGLWGLLWVSCAAMARQNSNPTPQEGNGGEQPFKIAGTVVNAITGVPLPQARVSIQDTRNRAQMISMVTGENGHFEFTSLPAGKYALRGARRGYISSGYEQHEQYSTAIVTGPEFATGNLMLRLTPMAMILGHVLDESGEPLRSARVSLFLEDHGGGMSRVTRLNTATSDDRGYFDFNVLSPGTYFVSVSAKPWYAVHPSTAQELGDSGQHVPVALDVAYLTTYYGGTTDAESAMAIEVKGGEHEQVDIRMSPVPALHLLFRTGVEEPGQRGGFTMPVLQKRVFDSVEFVQHDGMNIVSPGVYEITGVPAGRYNVTIKSSTPGEAEQSSEMDLLHDGQDLNGTPGEPLGSLKVTVKMPGNEALPRQYAVALQDSRQRTVAFRQGDAFGEASFEDVTPGKYGIVFAAPGKLYSVARTSSSAGESVGHDVTVAPGAALEVTAVLSAGVVRMEGVVEKNGKPVAGVMVVLVPNDPAAHGELFRRDQSDFDGTFALQSVVPGMYTIVAVEDAWGFEWLKPGVLARYVQHGQNVNVGELMRGTVRLPEAVEVQGR